MDDIVQGSDVIGFDACFLKLFSIEFRVSMASPELEFKFVELEGFQFFAIHGLHFRIEVFSNLHRFPICKLGVITRIVD